MNEWVASKCAAERYMSFKCFDGQVACGENMWDVWPLCDSSLLYTFNGAVLSLISLTKDLGMDGGQRMKQPTMRYVRMTDPNEVTKQWQR